MANTGGRPQRIGGALILALLLAFEGVLHYAPFSFLRAPLAFLLFFFPALAWVQALLPEEGEGWEKYILTLALPPALYTLILYLLTFYFHRPFWPSLHFSIVALALLTGVKLLFFEKKPWAALPWPGRDNLLFLFLFLLLLLTLVPQVYPVTLIDPHGSYYASVSYQIQKDLIPPPNTMLYGASVATYWLYFLYLSILCSLTGFSPLQASIFSNIFSLLVLFLIFYAMARRLYQRRTALWSAGLIALFGVNLWGYLFFLGRTAQESLGSPAAAAAKTSHFWKILPPYVDFAPLMGLFHKYLFYSGFPLGLLYLGLMLWSALSLLSGEKKKAAVFSTLGSLGALQFHPPTAFFHLAFILGAMGVLWLYTRIRNQGFSPRLFLYLILPFMVSMVITLPYLQETSSARPERLLVFRFRRMDFLRQFMLLCPVIPLFVLGAWNFLKRVKFTELFFLGYALLTLAAAIFIRLPYMNNYKFSYLTALGMGLVAGSFFEELKKITLGRVILGALFFSVMLNIMALDFSFISMGRTVPGNKFINEQGLVWFRDSREPLAAACDWIREHTDPRAVFLQYPLPREPEILTLPLLAQRRLYVADFQFFAQGLKGFKEKKTEADYLFKPQAKGKELILKQLAQIPAPLYILLEKGSLPAAAYYEPLAGEFESLYASWLKKVYEQAGVKIYKLQKGNGV